MRVRRNGVRLCDATLRVLAFKRVHCAERARDLIRRGEHRHWPNVGPKRAERMEEWAK